jgi:hypothetical protein
LREEGGRREEEEGRRRRKERGTTLHSDKGDRTGAAEYVCVCVFGHQSHHDGGGWEGGSCR